MMTSKRPALPTNVFEVTAIVLAGQPVDRDRPDQAYKYQSKRPKTEPTTPPSHIQPRNALPELLRDAPMRLVLVGHNPSDHAWQTGHYYSNPSNYMWRILRSTGIAPPEVQDARDDHKLRDAGVGMTDVGTGHPGTDSASFKSAAFVAWRTDFYTRLASHRARACASIGCTCGCCGQPLVLAFVGKRQLQELYTAGMPGSKAPRLEVGAPVSTLPPGWPLHPEHTEVWLLPSTSGAAAMTLEQRVGPFARLAERLVELGAHPGRRCPVAHS